MTVLPSGSLVALPQALSTCLSVCKKVSWSHRPDLLPFALGPESVSCRPGPPAMRRGLAFGAGGKRTPGQGSGSSETLALYLVVA